MARAIAFVDGFNLYHSLEETPALHKYEWLNLRALVEQFLTTTETLEDVQYFTAYTEWNQERKGRHTAYVGALRSTRVQITFGQFLEKEKKSFVLCNNPCKTALAGQKCGKTFLVHEEKKTDVNIAVAILRACVEDRCDAIYLLSGDNDLIPALETGHALFPKKNFRVILPINAKANALKETCKKNGFKHLGIQEKHLQAAQFSKTVVFGEKIFTCPPSWQ